MSGLKMKKISIHFDCDTGQDDAIALLYALGSEKINVKSISVVGGNVDVEQCAYNTLGYSCFHWSG
jgi:inosine-uridine nucleoside N-ribohydrolase